MREEEQIAAVVESWRRAEEAGDAGGLKALWAQTHPRLTYQPTEREAPLTSFAEIADYYDRICSRVRSKAWRTWDVVVDVISSETAFAVTLMDMLFQSEHSVEQYWQGRASFVMIKLNGEWKIVHYEDSTLIHFLVPVIQRAQRPSLEKCISLIEARQSEQCLPLLHELLGPIPPGQLARANHRPAAYPTIR